MNANANIAGHLPEMARRYPNRTAIVVPHRKTDPLVMTFGALDLYSDRLVRQLTQTGITAGTLTALMIPPSVQFAAYTFALFKLGAIPVMIDPGMGISGVDRCLADAGPQAFVGSRKAHWARRLFGWGRSTIQNCVALEKPNAMTDNSVNRRSKSPASSEFAIYQESESDMAAILFTSGSTGPAKGAVYTHGMFQEQVQVMREVFGIEPGEVDLCTFPLFAQFAPALGMTSIVPEMNPTRPAEADPKKIIKAIIDYKATNLFGSPALIDVLSRYGERHDIRLPTLRRVISAGAPVSAAVVERMTKMLNPGVQVFTPYGATEALPIAVIGSDEILSETRQTTDQGAGICVGRPVGRTEVQIITIDDGPIRSPSPGFAGEGFGVRGEICVRGPVVSRTYWNRPDADALHKIQDGDTVWHRTGDIGYFDDQGRLWFCGRKGQRVVLPEQTLFTIPVEAVFNVHPDVFRAALVGARINGSTRPVLCVELEKQCRRRPAAILPELAAIRDQHSHTAAIRNFLFHPGFSVDIRHNAKINREKLAIWAARRLR
jgi:olefin beta-lactone synthetase